MAMNAELRALHLMCKHYEDGLSGMALVLGINGDLLGKRLREDQGHRLSVVDVSLINEACIRKRTPNCFAYINVVAGNAGMSFNPLPVVEMTPCVPRSSALVMREVADLASTMMESVADDHFCDNDLKRVENDGAQAIAAIQTALAACRARHGADKRVVE